jgi:REP-associated tyrosine transposase
MAMSRAWPSNMARNSYASATNACRRRWVPSVVRHDGGVTRPPRLQLAGGVFHIMARGVRRQLIFCDQRDFEFFLGLLANVAGRYGWRIRAYSLMRNHFHLLIETPDESLSAGMHRLNGGYAQWFNEHHQVEGHVFERRFASILVEAEPHLLELLRYIVLNPVRAGLCAHPGEWRWSSYRATAGRIRTPRLLALEGVWSLFGSEPGAARQEYERFVALGLEQVTRAAA